MNALRNRREVLAALAAAMSAPLAFAESPATPALPPAGSARYLIELLAFRPPGPTPARAYPVPALTPAQTLPGCVEPLGSDQFQLGAARDALAHKGNFKILSHLVWAAIVPPNGRTTTHLADLSSSDEPGPLVGSLAVQRSQYLFMGLELDYSVGNQTFGLREKRRVKFGERHYFDHPAFGVIAQITALKGAAAGDAI
jgi:Peptidoglycan-binding protein, CsiV